MNRWCQQAQRGAFRPLPVPTSSKLLFMARPAASDPTRAWCCFEPLVQAGVQNGVHMLLPYLKHSFWTSPMYQTGAALYYMCVAVERMTTDTLQVYFSCCSWSGNAHLPEFVTSLFMVLGVFSFLSTPEFRAVHPCQAVSAVLVALVVAHSINSHARVHSLWLIGKGVAPHSSPVGCAIDV